MRKNKCRHYMRFIAYSYKMSVCDEQASDNKYLGAVYVRSFDRQCYQ